MHCIVQNTWLLYVLFYFQVKRLKVECDSPADSDDPTLNNHTRYVLNDNLGNTKFGCGGPLTIESLLPQV